MKVDTYDDLIKLRALGDGLVSAICKEHVDSLILDVSFHVCASSQSSKQIDLIVSHGVKYCNAFHACFERVFVQSFPIDCTSEMCFMSYIVPRCWKFCTSGFIFLSNALGYDRMVFCRFLIVCSFITELVLYCVKKDCFRFVGTACKCLVAIFNETLKFPFDVAGGWEGLVKYCEEMHLFIDHVNYIMRAEDGSLNADDLVNEIVSRIESCSDIGDIYFILKENDWATDEMVTSLDGSTEISEQLLCELCKQNCVQYIYRYEGCDLETHLQWD